MTFSLCIFQKLGQPICFSSRNYCIDRFVQVVWIRFSFHLPAWSNSLAQPAGFFGGRTCGTWERINVRVSLAWCRYDTQKYTVHILNAGYEISMDFVDCSIPLCECTNEIHIGSSSQLYSSYTALQVLFFHQGMKFNTKISPEQIVRTNFLLNLQYITNRVQVFYLEAYQRLHWKLKRRSRVVMRWVCASSMPSILALLRRFLAACHSSHVWAQKRGEHKSQQQMIQTNLTPPKTNILVQ